MNVMGLLRKFIRDDEYDRLRHALDVSEGVLRSRENVTVIDSDYANIHDEKFIGNLYISPLANSISIFSCYFAGRLGGAETHHEITDNIAALDGFFGSTTQLNVPGAKQ